MLRICLGIFLMLTLSISASAKMLQFIPGTLPEGENPLIVYDDGRFEVADEPKSPPNDFQYPALVPFDVEVLAADGSGGSMPVRFSLTRLSTVDDKLNMIFENDTYANLFLQFDVPGLQRGDPIPDHVVDADGVIGWNAPSLAPPSGSSPALAGSLLDAMIVPEPASLATLLAAFAGLMVWRRRSAC